jgi:Fuc2NAc and GlcNAc transferase
MIDHPNERSSHETPTPRGGGLSIVIAFLISVIATHYFGVLPANLVYAITAGGFLVALVGFIDDHNHVSSKIRLLVHFAAAGIAVYFLKGMPGFYIGEYYFSAGSMSYPIAVFIIVWLINLTNFMDGIDGIASSEAICFSLLAAVLLYYDVKNDLFLLMFTLVAACLGFLVWNWPPAKIFMGDACSGFLGFLFGVFVIFKPTGAEDSKTFVPLLIILAVFICDATFTLFRRVLRGEKFHQPHRIHGYQHASRKYSHLTVTSAVIALNLLILTPLSLVAYFFSKYALAFFLPAYIIVLIILIINKAGVPEE